MIGFLAAKFQRRVTGAAVQSLFMGAEALDAMSAGAEHDRFRIRTTRDVRYSADQRLDVIRPIGCPGPLPIVIHVHGGGFTMLSKDSHRPIAEAYARRGFLVFNVDYRLAPEHRFPAALEDACAAYCWVVDNAHRFGGDLSRLVLAGESAGANLLLGLAIAATTRRPELYARRVFATGVVPRAIVPASGLLQVSNPERLSGSFAGAIARREVARVRDAYVAGDSPPLADPLLLIESDMVLDRPFPATFAPSGGADPLRDDARRLAAALRRRALEVEAIEYAGEPHSFHAFMWRAAARTCWTDTFGFLDRVLSHEISRVHTLRSAHGVRI